MKEAVLANLFLNSNLPGSVAEHTDDDIIEDFKNFLLNSKHWEQLLDEIKFENESVTDKLDFLIKEDDKPRASLFYLKHHSCTLIIFKDHHQKVYLVCNRVMLPSDLITTNHAIEVDIHLNQVEIDIRCSEKRQALAFAIEDLRQGGGKSLVEPENIKAGARLKEMRETPNEWIVFELLQRFMEVSVDDESKSLVNLKKKN